MFPSDKNDHWKNAQFLWTTALKGAPKEKLTLSQSVSLPFMSEFFMKICEIKVQNMFVQKHELRQQIRTFNAETRSLHNKCSAAT